jgi:hypothetical protein
MKSVAYRSARSLAGFVWISLCASVLFAWSGPLSAATWYVKPGGNDAATGADWTSAKASIGAAIQVAGDGDEIWVAAGRYVELVRIKAPGAEQPVRNVALYGGFSGDETELGQRDPWKNRTTIDGNALGIAIIIQDSAAASTRIDGFHVTGGRGLHGGGIKVIASGPVIANNLIQQNMANGLGAGISISGGRPLPGGGAEYAEVKANVIADNLAFEDSGDGGGIGINYASPLIQGNLIVRNIANQNGGAIAIYNNSAPHIIGNWMLSNTANFLKGGSSCSFGGGAIFATSWDLNCEHVQFAMSRPLIANNVIAANGAWQGGGVLFASTDATPQLINNTIAANSGAGVYWSESGLLMANNIIAFNSEGLNMIVVGDTSVSMFHNNVYGNTLQDRETDYVGLPAATGTQGNVSLDPGFTNYMIGEFHLQPGSPCIDAGDDSWVVDTGDIDGVDRISGAGVDIGADEFDGTVWDGTPTVIHVSPVGDDDSDGLSWASAKATLPAAIFAAANQGGEVWVAAGQYSRPVDWPILMPAFVQVYGGFAGHETTRDLDTRLETIVDGAQRVPVIRFHGAGYGVSRIDGLVIQNGGKFLDGQLSLAHDDYVLAQGGGIVSWVNGPVIANCIVRRNAVGTPYTSGILESGSGAGMAGYMSTAVLLGNVFEDNEVWNNIEGFGAGVFFERSAATLKGNVFARNRAEHAAAMAFLGAGSTALVAGNVIEDHWMHYYPALGIQTNYGAVVCRMCDDFRFERNLVRDNHALTGGGLHLDTIARGRVEGNVFLRNRAVDDMSGLAGWGGGIFVQLSSIPTGDIEIVNNTFFGNIATPGMFYTEQGGAIAVWGLPWGLGSANEIAIANNIFAENSSAVTLNLFSSVGVKTLEYNLLFSNKHVNLASDPTELEGDPFFVNAETEDFRIAMHSPAVDAGRSSLAATDGADFQWLPRRQGTQVDIGAFERPAYSTAVSTVSYGAAAGQKGVSLALWDPTRGRYFSHVLAGLGGSYLAKVSLTPETVKGQAVIPDLNANGVDEFATLEVNSAGFIELKIKDGQTAALLGKMPFEVGYHPLWLRAVPVPASEGRTAVALLGISPDGRPRAQVRYIDSGELISRVFFDPAYQPFGFELVADLNSNGFPEIAVFGRDAVGRVRAQVKDMLTGQLVSMVYFERTFVPAHGLALDTTGDGQLDALAVLGINDSGIVRAQVKAAAMGTPLGIVRFESGYTPHAFVAVPRSGPGTPDHLAVLQSDALGRVRVQVKHALTGDPVSIVSFPRTHEPRALAVLPDVSGNGHAELAYLGEMLGNYLFQVRDSQTGQVLATAEPY